MIIRPVSLILSFALVLALLGGGLYAYDRIVTQPLREQLRNPLLDRDLLEKILKAAAAGGATAQAPVHVSVSVPGMPGAPQVPITLTLQQPPPAAPGQPAPPPRLVAEAPSILCRTEEECRRIYGAAPQAFTIDAQINRGVLAWVCLEDLKADGTCPDGKEAARPLSRPVAFQIQGVQSERGVFHGLNPVGAPVTVTKIRTETQVDVRVPAPPLPYHLAAFVRADVTSGNALLGLRYTNRIGAGFYEAEPAWRYDPRLPEGKRTGFSFWVGYIHPIR